MEIRLPDIWKPHINKINVCQFLYHTLHLDNLSDELNMLFLIVLYVHLTIHISMTLKFYFKYSHNKFTNINTWI